MFFPESWPKLCDQKTITLVIASCFMSNQFCIKCIKNMVIGYGQGLKIQSFQLREYEKTGVLIFILLIIFNNFTRITDVDSTKPLSTKLLKYEPDEIRNHPDFPYSCRSVDYPDAFFLKSSGFIVYSIFFKSSKYF